MSSLTFTFFNVIYAPEIGGVHPFDIRIIRPDGETIQETSTIFATVQPNKLGGPGIPS